MFKQCSTFVNPLTVRTAIWRFGQPRHRSDDCFKSRLTVVSRAAKQSRTSDTTVCYIHERSTLIEHSLKACYKKYLMKKQRALQEQLPITSNIRLLLNKYSLFIFSNIPWPLCRILLLLLLRILIKDVGVAPKNFEAYISTCILARAMKLLLQALQRYIILFKSSWSSSLLLFYPP